MSLSDWAKNDWLKPHKTSKDEIKRLFTPELLILLEPKIGGEREIRTLGRVTPSHAFEACSFNHSDISPDKKLFEQYGSDQYLSPFIVLDSKSRMTFDFHPRA